MTLRQQFKYWLFTFVPGMSGRFRYFGAPLYFPRHALIFRIICEDGIFERDIVRRMVTLARPRTTVMDVGANLGLMAIPVLRDCPECRVVSFEPSPGTVPFLKQTAAASPHRDRWTVIDRALADTEGELDFTVGTPQEALFEGFRSHERIKGGRVVKVPVSTLDAEWRRLGEPEVSLVKIDVEGAEGGVLAGAAALLERWRPTLIVEWSAAYLGRYGTPPADLVRLANRHGYRIFTIPGGIAVDDDIALQVQMLQCENFLLTGAPPS